MSIQELEDWFKNAPAPAEPIFLDEATKINSYSDFVNSHFIGIKAAKVDYTRNPLIARLLKLKKII